MGTDAKALVLLSGGLDSFAAMLMAPSDALLLFIDYGQSTLQREDQAAETIALAYDRELHRLKLEVGGLLQMAGDPDADIQGQKGAFMPGRNLMLLTLAAMVAYQVDPSEDTRWDLHTGIRWTEPTAYPDCKHLFLANAEKAIASALGRYYRVLSRLGEKKKWMVWSTIYEMGGEEAIQFAINHTATGYSTGMLKKYEWGKAPERLDHSSTARMEGYYEFRRRQNEL